MILNGIEIRTQVYNLVPTTQDIHLLQHSISIHRTKSPFYTGPRWAIRYFNSCLNQNGQWECEPLPSSRDEAFYQRCRFTSFRLASEAATIKAQTHKINGFPVYMKLTPH